jgi:hypothetical protein
VLGAQEPNELEQTMRRDGRVAVHLHLSPPTAAEAVMGGLVALGAERGGISRAEGDAHLALLSPLRSKDPAHVYLVSLPLPCLRMQGLVVSARAATKERHQHRRQAITTSEAACPQMAAGAAEAVLAVHMAAALAPAAAVAPGLGPDGAQQQQQQHATAGAGPAAGVGPAAAQQQQQQQHGGVPAAAVLPTPGAPPGLHRGAQQLQQQQQHATAGAVLPGPVHAAADTPAAGVGPAAAQQQQQQQHRGVPAAAVLPTPGAPPGLHRGAQQQQQPLADPNPLELLFLNQPAEKGGTGGRARTRGGRR